ncbi:MAG: cation diffusion facilitator family transporter [Bacilli bacterium]
MKNKLVIRVLLIISALNLLSFTIKFVLGLSVDSNAVIADSFHSLSDLLANFVGMFAIYLSFKPADNNRMYGYEKIENLASLIISFILFFTGSKVVYEAIKSFDSPNEVNITIVSICIMASTLIINSVVVVYETMRGRKLKSSFLLTDAKHTLSDIYITIGVVVNMIVIKMGFSLIIDLVVSIIIGLIIIKTGLEVFLKAISVLLDSSIIETNKLETIINSFDEVCEVHYLKNRGNEINVYVEGHIMFEPYMSVYSAHEVVEKIEERISETFEYNFRFYFHIEPYVDQYKIK